MAVTPVDVLDVAIDELFVKGNFTAEGYHLFYSEPEDGCYKMSTFSLELATMHCAIGGVEHAIWKLTGRDVQENRGGEAYVGGMSAIDGPRRTLYARVMGALNDEAVKVARNDDRVADEGKYVSGVEDLTMDAPVEVVEEVFRSVRDQFAKKAAR